MARKKKTEIKPEVAPAKVEETKAPESTPTPMPEVESATAPVVHPAPPPVIELPAGPAIGAIDQATIPAAPVHQPPEPVKFALVEPQVELRKHLKRIGGGMSVTRCGMLIKPNTKLADDTASTTCPSCQHSAQIMR